MSDGEGFLSRWSRRKAQRPGDLAAKEPASPAPAGVPVAGTTGVGHFDAPLAAPTPADAAGAASSTPAAAPLPTLDDVANLTRESDFSPYVARQVDPQVRNAAMKKLFSDPHFNVMDGLDTYIDDYGKPDPLPLSMLRQMTSARALGLFAEEDAAEAKTKALAASDLTAISDTDAHAKATPDGALPTALAQSPPDEAQAPHEDTDLRLQPDDAARRPGLEPGPRSEQG